MTVYKHERRTIWHFSYLWIDDANWNAGYRELRGSFIGTQKNFDDYRQEEQDGQGFSCWQVKKRHATKAEYDEFVNWL